MRAMLLLLTTISMAPLIVGVGNAQDKGKPLGEPKKLCFYAGKQYSDGAWLCQESKLMKCVDGRWLDRQGECGKPSDGGDTGDPKKDG